MGIFARLSKLEKLVKWENRRPNKNYIPDTLPPPIIKTRKNLTAYERFRESTFWKKVEKRRRLRDIANISKVKNRVA